MAIRAISLLIAALLLVPIVGVGLLSVSPTYGMDIFQRWDPSPRWWRDLLTDPSWLHALTGSLAVAALSALVALLVTLPAAIAWRLYENRVAGHMLVVAGLTLSLPPIVLAVGLYRLLDRLGLFDTATGLSIAHLAFTVPVTALVLRSRFGSTPRTLYLVARGLGANSFHAAASWLLATQRATLVAGCAAAILTSMSEVTVTLYVTDTRVRTIARRALSGITRDIQPTGFAAMTGWMVLLSIVTFVLIRTRKSAQSES